MTAEPMAIGSDHAGFTLKQELKSMIEARGITVIDVGSYDTSSCDYPDIAAAVATEITTGRAGRGLLVCGSGIGMSIAANRHRGVRAALCHDGLTASLSRQHNDANVLCLGARVIGSETARHCLSSFLETGFEGGRHQKRVDKLS